MTLETPNSDRRVPSRWELIREVTGFQLKLVADAIRDLILGPLSIVAGILDVLAPAELANCSFYKVMQFGRRTEHWINLFGALDHLDTHGPDESNRQGVDALVERLEGAVKRTVEKRTTTPMHSPNDALRPPSLDPEKDGPA